MNTGPPLLATPYTVMIPIGAIVDGPDHVENYLSGESMGLGIAMIFLGALSVVFNCIGFAASDVMAVVSHGIYCGALVSDGAVYFPLIAE